MESRPQENKGQRVSSADRGLLSDLVHSVRHLRKRLVPTLFLFLQAGGASEPSIFELFWSSGPIAKFVFLILGVMSVVSWSIMLGKFFQLKKISAQTKDFMEVFRGSQRFSEVNAAATHLSASPLVGLFQAGYAELDSQIKAAQSSEQAAGSGGYQIRSLESLRRSLRRAIKAVAGTKVHGHFGKAFIAVFVHPAQSFSDRAHGRRQALFECVLDK